MNSNWEWGPAWNRVRHDINVLAWLFEEERVVQRLYMESFMWAITGKRFTVAEFAKEVGVGAADQGSPYDSKQSAQGALDTGGQGQV